VTPAYGIRMSRSLRHTRTMRTLSKGEGDLPPWIGPPGMLLDILQQRSWGQVLYCALRPGRDWALSPLATLEPHAARGGVTATPGEIGAGRRRLT